MSSRYRACPLTDAPFALPESILIATLSGVDRVHSPQFPNSMLARHQKNFWSQSGTVLGFLIVRVIALSTLKAFISRSSAYADAREPVMAWYRQVRGADWATAADVKRAIRTARHPQERPRGVQYRRKQLSHCGVDKLSLSGRLRPVHRHAPAL